MINLKKNYKIIAIGDIQLQAVENSQTEKILAKSLVKNHDAIEEIWQKNIKEKGGELSNRTLPNFIRVNKKGDKIKITAHFIEYKNFFARRKQLNLKLGIKPIGVSGIIILKENGNSYTVFAKRTINVNSYPDFFELVPSGSIDKECVGINGKIDYQSKLLSEFTEETGLSKDYVNEILGFALVLDTNNDVYDICCKIFLKIKKRSVIKKFLGSKEYHAPIFVPMNEVSRFIKDNSKKIVPTSIAIIEAFTKV